MGKEGEGAPAIIAGGVMKGKVGNRISKAAAAGLLQAEFPVRALETCVGPLQNLICFPRSEQLNCRDGVQEPAAETGSFSGPRNFGTLWDKMRKGVFST